MAAKNINPARLRDAFKTDLAACWRYARSLHPAETPYAFALQGLEDTPHFYPYVMTEEGLTRAAKRYVAEGSYDTLEEARKALRYSLADSPYAGKLEETLPTVNALMKPIEEALDETKGYSLLARAAIEAFVALDKSRIFGDRKKRGKLLLMIDTHLAEKDWSRASVKRLNSPTAFRRYEAETRIEGEYASCDALAISPDGGSLYSSEAREMDAAKQQWLREVVAYDVQRRPLKRRWRFILPQVGGVRGMACTPEGSLVVLRADYPANGAQTSVIRFDVHGKIICRAELPGEPHQFTVSPDGKKIAVVMIGRTIHILDHRLQVLAAVKTRSVPHGVHFLRSGDLFIASDSGLFRLNKNHKMLPTPYRKKLFAISIDHAEKLAAVSRCFPGSDTERERNAPFGFQILSLPKLAVVRSITIPGYQLVNATLSRNGKRVAFQAHQPGTDRNFVMIYNVASGAEIARRRSGFAASVAFFPKGTTVALTNSGFTKSPPARCLADLGIQRLRSCRLRPSTLSPFQFTSSPQQ